MDNIDWEWRGFTKLFIKKGEINMKKIVGLALMSCLCLGMLTGCGNEKSKDDKVQIGIAQIVEHSSLNTIRDSFKAEMIKLGYDESQLEFENAANDTSNLNSIMQKFAGDKKDVIVAIATPTAQTAMNYSNEIPVVFSAVSDPIGAGLMSDLMKPDKNITGTSDEIQVDQILDLALQINPDIKSIGFLYNTSEANSVSNLAKVKAYCEDKNISVVESAVTSISDVQTNAQVLVKKVDAVFTPNDNTVASAMSALVSEASKANIPVYTGADSMVKDGGFATVGIDYEELGKETARMTDKILKGEKVENLPVAVFKENLNVYINKQALQELGIELPEAIKTNEKLVYIE